MDGAPRLPPGGTREELLPGAFVDYVPGWIEAGAADPLMAALIEELALAEHEVTVFGRRHRQPRLAAWHAVEGCRYTYSGLALDPQPIGPELAALRARLHEDLGVDLNSVLANLYRKGADSMGWHADDEAVFGSDPVIASLSLGSPRRFRMRPRGGGDAREWSLGGGALFVMWGTTQRDFHHAVPKTARVVGPRLSLTFRPFQRADAGAGELA